MVRSLWKFLNTNAGVVILGFILTTLAGGIIAYWFDRLAWERETAFEAKRQNFEWERNKRFEILRRKLNEGQRSLEEISDLINLRFFRLHKVFENILAGDSASASDNWADYMESVEQWNTKLIINQNKLERLVSREASMEFNNYETDRSDLADPTSIHGQFFVAHRHVLQLLRCMRKPSCEITAEMRKDTNNALRNLDLHSDAFIDRTSRVFLERGYELEEFSAEP